MEISINHQLTLRHSTRVQFQMRAPPNDHYNAVLIANQLMKSPQVPASDVRWLDEFVVDVCAWRANKMQIARRHCCCGGYEQAKCAYILIAFALFIFRHKYIVINC
jgi:hypothetical protein